MGRKGEWNGRRKGDNRGQEGRRVLEARRGAWVGASGHFIFHFNWLMVEK